MSGQDIQITCGDGSFSGYLATPASGEGPGVIVIQEIFGVNQDMRRICDDLAAQGYVALSPDLFWRQEPGIQLTDQSEAEWARAFELFQGFDLAKGVEDLAATLNHLRDLKACTGKVGCVGFCLGGQLAYLMACRTTIDAAVGYYGVYIQDYIQEAGNIRRPLILHVAEKDEFVPPEAQKVIVDSLQDNGQVTLHSYPDDDHAFARVGGTHYNGASATLANERTLDLFSTNLR
jgi:carboxymethylenebutenolidase